MKGTQRRVEVCWGKHQAASHLLFWRQMCCWWWVIIFGKKKKEGAPLTCIIRRCLCWLRVSSLKQHQEPFQHLGAVFCFLICMHHAFKSTLMQYWCAVSVKRDALERRAWIHFVPGFWTTPQVCSLQWQNSDPLWTLPDNTTGTWRQTKATSKHFGNSVLERYRDSLVE